MGYIPYIIYVWHGGNHQQQQQWLLQVVAMDQKPVDVWEKMVINVGLTMKNGDMMGYTYL
jgi:hypothetical protein